MRSSPVGSVQGQVVRQGSGSPVGDAAIAVLAGAGPFPDMAVMTDPDGSFALNDLPAGEWRLSARGPNGETGQATVHVGDGAVATAVIRVG